MSREESLRRYLNEGYGLINGALGQALSLDDIQDKQVLTDIRNLDSLMERGPEIRLYRGMTLNLEEILSETTRILVHKNFCSASKSLDIATEFTDNGCCVLSFILPENIKRYEVQGGREREVLVQRNVQFEIQRSYRVLKGGVHVFDSFIVPYDPPVVDPAAAQRITRELDLLMIQADWEEELKNESFGKITEQEIKAFVKSNKDLNLGEEVYQILEERLLKSLL